MDRNYKITRKRVDRVDYVDIDYLDCYSEDIYAHCSKMERAGYIVDVRNSKRVTYKKITTIHKEIL